MMENKIVFRAATESDKDAILSISKGLFCNMDPLEGRFNEYISNIRRFSFLAEDMEHDNRAVSFLGLKIMDEGRTAYYYGARTREGYLGLGIQSKLLRYAFSTIKQQYPNLDAIRYGSWDPRYNTDEYFERHHNKKLVVRKPLLGVAMKTRICRANIDEWQSYLSHNTMDLRKIKPNQIVDYIEEESLQRVLDNGFLVYDFYCCEAKNTNNEAITELITDALIGLENGHVTSISTRCGFHTKDIQRYDIIINSGNHEITLLHLFQHIREIAQLHLSENVQLLIQLNSDTEDLREYLMSTGGFEDGPLPRIHRYTNIVQLRL